ncbi:MAG: hypothetical protein SGPRY_009564 [Prymnesium sp.]
MASTSVPTSRVSDSAVVRGSALKEANETPPAHVQFLRKDSDRYEALHRMDSHLEGSRQSWSVKQRTETLGERPAAFEQWTRGAILSNKHAIPPRLPCEPRHVASSPQRGCKQREVRRRENCSQTTTGGGDVCPSGNKPEVSSSLAQSQDIKQRLVLVPTNRFSTSLKGGIFSLLQAWEEEDEAKNRDHSCTFSNNNPDTLPGAACTISDAASAPSCISSAAASPPSSPIVTSATTASSLSDAADPDNSRDCDSEVNKSKHGKINSIRYTENNDGTSRGDHIHVVSSHDAKRLRLPTKLASWEDPTAILSPISRDARERRQSAMGSDDEGTQIDDEKCGSGLRRIERKEDALLSDSFRKPTPHDLARASFELEGAGDLLEEVGGRAHRCRSLRVRSSRPDYLSQIEIPSIQALIAEGWDDYAVEEERRLEAREKRQVP